jgi:C-terminal processing protease CtpA/Prc
MKKLFIFLIIIFVQVNVYAQSDQYNAACAAAKKGNPDLAFQLLKKIIGINYFNYDHLTSDPDFNSIHQDKRWQPLLNQIRLLKPAKISVDQLYADFDLMVSALKEAHTGLYWYITKPQFDSVCNAQRSKIRNGLNTLDFYNLAAPVIAYTKEGHSFFRVDQQTQAYLKFSGRYFPLYVKILDDKVYLINDIDSLHTKGLLLSKINGISIDTIMKKFMSYEPADGYNVSSKYRWIEENAKFNTYYSKCYPQTTFFDIEVTNPKNNQRTLYQKINSITYQQFRQTYQEAKKKIPSSTYTIPAIFKTNVATNTAILTLNTFDNKQYTSSKIDYRQFIKTSFQQLQEQKIKHLIIDLRNNGGGKEGYEDEIISYMTDQEYKKFDYVQASAFSYSFYPYTDYKGDWMELDSIMRHEHYLEKDGRILRKSGIEALPKPQPDPYKGKVYVLTSGLTYSAGSTLTTLLKNHTKAVFIGEEAGGGYYGNTSGIRIILKLPHSKLEVGIPILKFVLHTQNKTIPFGHGIIPDYYIQPTINEYLNNIDAEMIFAQKLISQQSTETR